ncbi:MAG: hypothetical protein JXA28_06985 [Bacteroidetes bacterium]|nr:hypothetical protein [Bacteroidota bacterium]
MKRTHVFSLVILCLTMLSACSEDTESVKPESMDAPQARLLNATDCKHFGKSTRENTRTSEGILACEGILASSESCIEYSYDAAKRSLLLTHVNAGFNCCPGVLSVQISVDDNIITIIEREQEAGCHCLCLYDLTMEIVNLPPGSYRIVVIEPYLHDEDLPLSFAVDVRHHPSGKSCVPRAHYPWGV